VFDSFIYHLWSCIKVSVNFYTAVYIFWRTWVKFDTEDCYVIPLSICKCSGYMCSERHIVPTDTKNICPIFYIFRPIWIKYSSRGPQKLFREREFCKNRCNKRYVLHISIIQNVSTSRLFVQFAEKFV